MRLSVIAVLFAVSLQAQVRYHFGDDPKWADPSLDDSAWPAVTADFPLPSANSDGMVWLRYRVPVAKGDEPLAVRLAREQSACTPGEAWVNGVHVGVQGRFPPQPDFGVRCATTVFELPAGSVSSGHTAVVAWRGWIPPIFRARVPYVSPQSFAVEIGSRESLRAHEQLAVNGVRLELDLETFIDLTEILLGVGLLILWWRVRGSPSLLWFSLVVVVWPANTLVIDAPAIWQVNWTYTFYWLLVNPVLTIPLNVVFLEFLRTSTTAPRKVVRGLEVVVVVWPVLWFLPVLAVTPVPLLSLLTPLGTLLFGVQQVGIILIALWVAIRQGRETRGLAIAFIVSAVASLFVDIFALVPTYLRWGGNRLFTDNLFTMLVIGAMCYLLMSRLWQDWRKKEELDAEFEAAREMQTRLVPADIAVPGFTIESAYHPARQVGGDFFRIIPVEDGSVLVVVGDVSGKGLVAAMTVAAIAGALDNEFSRDPAEVLAHLNRALLLRRSSGFVTCCAALIKRSGEAVIANAGHLSPYLDGREVAVEAGLPLGIVPDTSYPETTASGHRFTFISDGVLEAANAGNELFGFDRCREISGKPVAGIALAAQEWGQNDDITVLAVTREEVTVAA